MTQIAVNGTVRAMTAGEEANHAVTVDEALQNKKNQIHQWAIDTSGAVVAHDGTTFTPTAELETNLVHVLVAYPGALPSDFKVLDDAGVERAYNRAQTAALLQALVASRLAVTNREVELEAQAKALHGAGNAAAVEAMPVGF